MKISLICTIISKYRCVMLVLLVEQWHNLEYTNSYLNPTTLPYLRVWYKIFNSSRQSEWNFILLLVELLFCLPISNAKVEILFSLMKRIKCDSQASLGEVQLNNMIRICVEGPTVTNFNPLPAITLWANETTRRPIQRERKAYKSRKTSKKVKVLAEEEEKDYLHSK